VLCRGLAASKLKEPALTFSPMKRVLSQHDAWAPRRRLGTAACENGRIREPTQALLSAPPADRAAALERRGEGEHFGDPAPFANPAITPFYDC
jgi:hypothetical protein